MGRKLPWRISVQSQSMKVKYERKKKEFHERIHLLHQVIKSTNAPTQTSALVIKATTTPALVRASGSISMLGEMELSRIEL